MPKTVEAAIWAKMEVESGDGGCEEKE